MFTASEIVELGVQIEINGKEFYEELVKNTRKPKAKDLFSYLAEQEARHIDVFKKILHTVEEYEPKEAYPEEYFSHMNALASQYVFTQRAKGVLYAKNAKTTKEALETALGFEKESIEFYRGMKKIVPKEQDNLIDTLIKEEEKHVADLESLPAGRQG